MRAFNLDMRDARVWHSQTVKTSQPLSRKALLVLLSLAAFFASLLTQ